MSVAPAVWPQSERRERVLALLTEWLNLEASLVERAEALAVRTRRPIEQVLNQMGAVSDEALTKAYSEASGCAVWKPEIEPILADIDVGVRPEYLAERRLAPLLQTDRTLTIAACDPFDDEAFAALAFATGKTILARVAAPSNFRRASAASDAPEIRDSQRLDADLARVSEVGGESEAGRRLAQALEAAVARGASDLHVEPRRHDLLIRLRVDGRLIEFQEVKSDLAPAVVSRIKVLANLDLGERRLPQDGRATFVVQGRPVETRVSIIPTAFGEAAVLRILDRVGLSFDLNALGVVEQEADVLRRAMRASHGIFLISGPTGSGKTTTLYALLNMLAGAERKILSVEDPVEHYFAHVNQVQVAPAIGLTFASALRAFLRQDPDIILVGEIRDRETAAVAIQAAMTGHLVIASVHANDSVRVVPRLLDMGVEPYQLAAAFLGAAAQRLVRRLCPQCRSQRAPTAAEQVFITRIGQSCPDQVWSPGKCAACAETGFRGRVVMMEAYFANEDLAAAVARAERLDEVIAEAHRCGLRSMAADGIGKAIAGLTTLEEVMALIEL